MERLRLPNGSLVCVESTGDGFPLVLLPAPQGAAPWRPHMPLLSELCQAIAYEGCPPQPAIDLLPAVLDGLRLERVYLAAPLPEWPAALAFAGLRPQYVEAALFVEFPGSEAASAPFDSPHLLPAAELSVPALFLLAGDNSPGRAAADRLSVRLPGCRTVVLGSPAAAATGLPGSPQRQFPHLMMQFLLDRERHRNLVRGASFLL